MQQQILNLQYDSEPSNTESSEHINSADIMMKGPITKFENLQTSSRKGNTTIPKYGPPGLITFALRLRNSSSAWVMRSLVIW